jgi:hypothetical protein
MAKNKLPILVFIVLLIIIWVVLSPGPSTDVPVTAVPSNGIVDDAAMPTEEPKGEEMEAAPAANGEVMEPAENTTDMPADNNAEVDGVPPGAEVSGENPAPAVTTPAPTE